MNSILKTALVLVSLFPAVTIASHALGQTPPPPYACPLFPFLSFEFGDLYYCDFYEFSCDDPPEVAYIIGYFDWPADDCPEECIGALRKVESGPRPAGPSFPGLEHPVTSDYLHDDKLPTGDAREFITVLTDPKVSYLRCAIGGETIFAKVLVFAVRTGIVAGDEKKDRMRLRYVAFQTTRLPEGAVAVDVTCTPVYDDDKPCFAYRCTYQPAGTKPIAILVLTAR